MISAGQDFKTDVKDVSSKLCGDSWGYPQDGCWEDTLEPYIDAQTAGYSETKLGLFRDLYNRGVSWMITQCAIDNEVNFGDTDHKIGEPYTDKKGKAVTAKDGSAVAKIEGRDGYKIMAECMYEYVNGTKKMNVPGFGADQYFMKDGDEGLDFIEDIAQRADKASAFKTQSIPLPANLQQWIDDTKGVGAGYFSNKAEELFREALANVPVGKRLEAAQPGGVAGDHVENDDLDDIIDLMTGLTKEYLGAEVDGDKKKMQEVKDELDRTYVSKVDPTAPEFKVTFNEMPQDIVKLVFGKDADKVSPGVMVELRKLYVDTLKKFYDKGGDPKKQESVKKPFAEAVKKAGITDPKKSASQIRAIVVEDVILNNDKSAKEVKFGKAKNAGAPADLTDKAETGPKEAALQMLFNDIAELADLGKAKDPDDLTEKIVANLKEQGVLDMDAVGIAALYPTAVDKNTGAVKLAAVPQEAYDSWQELVKEEAGKLTGAGEADVPDSTIGKTAMGGMHAITRIYSDAMKDKDAKWNKDEAAKAANQWVKKIEKEDNDWQTTTDRIVSGKYAGRNPDGSMKIDEDGDSSSVYTDNGILIGKDTYAKPYAGFNVGLFAGDSVTHGGANMSLEVKAGLGIEKIINDKHVVGGLLGVGVYNFPKIVDADVGAFSSNDGYKGSFSPVDYGDAGLSIKMDKALLYYKFKGATASGINVVPELRLGLDQTYPYDAMGDALPYDSVNNWPYFIAGKSSRAPQGYLGVTVASPVKGRAFGKKGSNVSATFWGDVRSAESYFQVDNVSLFNGVALDFGAKVALDFCGMSDKSADKAICEMVVGYEYGKAFGDYDASVHAVSGAMLTQLHEHFGLNLGGKGLFYEQSDEHLPPKSIQWALGINPYVPITTKSGWNLTVGAWFSGGNVAGDFTYTGRDPLGSNDDSPNTDEDCDPDPIFGGCEEGTEVDGTDNGPAGGNPEIDDQMSYGETLLSYGAYLAVSPEKAPQLKMGVKAGGVAVTPNEGNGRNDIFNGGVFLDYSW